MLEAGYHDVPAGHVAAVVTHLEMHAAPPLRSEAELALTLARETETDLGAYRALYRRIGAPWLWFGHLVIDDEELRAILDHPEVHRYTLRDDAHAIGLLVLDFRVAGECELTYFGVVADRVGEGAGRWLMNRALERAWREDVHRVHVHTCTNDHPAALPFYLRSGFKAFKREIEIARDPRLQGIYATTDAPHIPILAA